jgi:hypothetical protein
VQRLASPIYLNKRSDSRRFETTHPDFLGLSLLQY